jgi:glycosyltransferase involved in cell wall biosynthesis/GT2 family glycosyltransferase
MPVVLIISYSGAIGGAERLLVDFAGALEGEVCLACPEGPLADAGRSAGLRVFASRPRSLRWRGGFGMRGRAVAGLAGYRFGVRRLVRDLDPDLVVAWGMRAALALLLVRRPAAPAVFQHNDLLPAGGALRWAVRRAARQADLVVSLSEAIARDLGEPAAVVHPGVDVESFPVSEPGAPVVLVLGALVQWKQPDLALEAVAIARRTLPGVRLRLVGAPLPGDDPAFVERLRARAAAPDLAGAVSFVGAVADPRDELARAACLLHCAQREPFGMVVLEALATGLPVIAPAAAGPSEIVDSSCGVLYPPGDAAAAAEAVAGVLSDPARAVSMGAAGRRRARERFDRAAAVARYASVVGAVRRRPPPGDEPQFSSGARNQNAKGRSRPPLGLVTVTHNSAAELRALLASVERHIPDAHVVVVDCASGDDSVAVARDWPGGATVLPIENVGFGRGSNAGVAHVTAAVTVLVNPDVELLDDSLLAAAAEAESHDRLLAPRVLTPGGEREDSVHPVPGSVPNLLGALVPHELAPAALVPWRGDRPRRVGWAVGAALVARTDTLRRLGPFDEGIFMYGEDLDLSLRAAQAGVETWFWPAARVVHRRSHSTHAAFGGEPLERLVRARQEVVGRRLGPGRARLDTLGQAAMFGSRLLAKRALGREAARERTLLRSLLAGRRRAPR